ncbi:MAG: AmmeMemoRadiSam system protein B [Deltaproteobacteria bacterium]|nr:AmmeMemoRadiSam system protein B [Deltaproteobacteria bacterium]
MVRKPAVAGQFYPGTADRLRAFLDEAMPPRPDRIRAVGVVAPHAGYVYSGKVAGEVFGRVEVPSAALLLGPNHTGRGAVAAVAPEGAWATPLGEAPIDADLSAALRAASPLLTEDDLAHAREHSLEVEVPFLQHRNPAIKIVPIALRLRSAAEIESLGNAIASVLAARPEPCLLVASSDMSHYEPEARTRAKDAQAIEKVLALDPKGLLDVTGRAKITMCGVIPTAVLLTAARRLGATRGELAAYTTSGETSRDYDAVVGYAGILIV